MQQLDDAASAPQSPSTVLHMVCALGAKFYALKTLENVDDPALAGGFVLEAGSQWARTAHQHIFANLNNLSLDNAMAIVLLHDHELRLGNYATAFMLSGLAVRMGQALQLKSESSTDVLCRNSDGLTPSARESRRRLAWAIYVMDAWAGTPLIPEHAMRIQLPCNERNFVFELPCVVESLEVGSYLPFLSPKTRAEGSSNDLDLIAQFIRLISIRRKVLRYVRIAHTQEPPWFATSEYADLEAKLARWNERLPSSLRFDKAAIYMRKESSQLGGLLFLHFTYHQTLCDLTQLGMQDLFKTHAGLVFPVEQQEFQKAMQDQCFQHAVSISTIFDEAFRHGIDALADTWLGVVAQDSSTVIIHYISRDLGTTDKDEQFKNQAVACLHSNLRALKRMLPLYALAKPLYMSTVNVVKKHGLELPPSMEVSPVSTIEHSDRSSVEGGSQLLQFTPDHVIDPLTILSLARPSDQRISRQRPQHTVRAESTHHTLSSSLSQVTHSTGLTLDTIHASAAPVPADPQIIYEAVMPLMDGFESMDLESLQLPTSLDDLQTYFPLMIHNPTSPMQHGLLDMPPGGNGMTGFADPTAYSYPQPPTGPDLTLTGMSTAFPPVTQPQWPSGPG
ncbi:hypothetical protein GQ53DRAFT_749463 [Thozetella sp. PMI_491]|nr:hypothetical protein GQ53DRAFT_749463 [Thozetella sp. PMI_491]